MKKFLVLAFMLSACGPATKEDETPIVNKPPAPQPTPSPGGELTFAADVQPLLQNFCAECHSQATFMSNEEAFLASKSATRIANRSMPQRQSKTYAQWGDAQRKIIADFVSQQ